MRDHEIKWREKPLRYIDYADDLSILDESVSKMNELLEVLQVQGARIGSLIRISLIRTILVDFVLRSTGKVMRDHEIKWREKPLRYIDYADDLSILDESVSKMNELLEVLQVQGARIGLKINV